jgi:uncharacterized protein DUF4124
MKLLSVALGLALFVALPASAQMYKWVDSDGKVNYSDKPPPSNIKTEKLRVPGRGASTPMASEAKDGTQKDEAKDGTQKDAAAAGTQKDAAKAGTQKDAATAGTQKDAAKAGPKTAAEQEQAFRKRKLDAAKAQEKEGQKQAEARDRAENCKRAKAALANLQIGGRQSRVDDKGERVFLDDQQIAQETAKARQEAAAACN